MIEEDAVELFLPVMRVGERDVRRVGASALGV